MEVLYHCPCIADVDPEDAPSTSPSTSEHHALSSLFFCEECDAIRCDRCVSCEISCYYCPNCLFEVPSASVRGEKNRCARNCFLCPSCSHTLAVVASDPEPGASLTAASANIGEPPYHLSCNFCRWDSKEVGITFEKPTGLAAQLVKFEENAPELLEFDHVKDHLEPFLRQGHSSAAPHAYTSSPATAAASAALSSTILKDISGLGARYGSLYGLAGRSRSGDGAKNGSKEDLDPYESLIASGGVSDQRGQGYKREQKRIKFMHELTDVDEVVPLEQRWTQSWDQPLRTQDLKPQRIPLRSKLQKRCPVCRHIVVKPADKMSIKFKIKLVASNYLPSVDLFRRPPLTIGSRLSAISAGTASGLRRSTRTGVGSTRDPSGTEGEEPLRQGRSYTYEMSFTNPLYEPIHVRLAIARPPPSTLDDTCPSNAYQITLPAPSFPISAFAEVWEYEDDEEEDLMKEDTSSGSGDREGGGGFESRARRMKGPGVIERKANRTTVLLELSVGRDAVGPVRMNMLVTYTYSADENPAEKGPAGKQRDSEIKSFSFWTLLALGSVQARTEETRRRLATSIYGAGQ